MWSVEEQKSAFTVFLVLKMRRKTPITIAIKRLMSFTFKRTTEQWFTLLHEGNFCLHLKLKAIIKLSFTDFGRFRLTGGLNYYAKQRVFHKSF